MVRRKKQKKQVKEALDLRTFEHTEKAEELDAAFGDLALPSFFIDSIAGAYGAAASSILEGIAQAKDRPVTFRANTLKSSAEEVVEALYAAGIEFKRVPWYADAFIVPASFEQAVWNLDLIHDGKIYLQSLSSMLPPLALAMQAGQDILDMCAAPGGKTTQIAALEPQAHVTAAEMHAPRADKLEHNLEKQGAKNVQVMRVDARELDEFFSFDRILLDAPCTGSGTLIAGCERTLKGFSEQLLQKCARSQRALLDRGLTVLKPGGYLLYSTCSVLPQENEDAVAHALKKHRDCELVALDKAEDADGNPTVATPFAELLAQHDIPVLHNEIEGTVTVAPSREYEGFFLALMTKKR